MSEQRSIVDEIVAALAVSTTFIELDARGHRDRGEPRIAEPSEAQAAKNRRLIERYQRASVADGA